MFIAPTKDPNSVILRHSASVGAVGSPPRDLLPFFGVNVARRRRGMGETKRKRSRCDDRGSTSGLGGVIEDGYIILPSPFLPPLRSDRLATNTRTLGGLIHLFHKPTTLPNTHFPSLNAVLPYIANY